MIKKKIYIWKEWNFWEKKPFVHLWRPKYAKLLLTENIFSGWSQALFSWIKWFTTAYLRYIKLEKIWKSPNIWNSLNPRQHRSTAKTVLAWNQSFPYDFGSLNPNPASVFPHHVEILQYCQFHGCQVRKSVLRVLWKNYKRYRKSKYI